MAIFVYPPTSIDTTGLATEAKQDTIITELIAVNAELDGQTTLLTSLDGKDFATQTTLASLDGKDFATQTTLASIDGKDFATQTTLASIDGKDFATQTTSAALLTELQAKADLTETQPVSAASLPLPTGASTEAKQDSAITELQSIVSATPANLVDTNNSTSTPLGISGTFVGTGTDVLKYNSISIILFADQDSAADGIKFQFSTDNVNWDESSDFNLVTATSNTRRFQFPVTAQYFRINYTNGTSAQTAFRVQTILHTTDILTSIHRIDGTLINDRSVTVTKSVIAGETTAGGGSFVNVKVNPSGEITSEVNQSVHDDLNTNANIQVGDADVSGGNPVPMSAASLPLPTGAATQTTSAAILTELQLKADLTETQPVSAASLPLPTGAATEATLQKLEDRLAGSLVPEEYDEITVTYRTTGNGIGEIDTVVYELATVTIATLTLTYDASDRLSNVIKS